MQIADELELMGEDCEMYLGKLFPGLCDEEVKLTIYDKKDSKFYCVLTYFDIVLGKLLVIKSEDTSYIEEIK